MQVFVLRRFIIFLPSFSFLVGFGAQAMPSTPLMALPRASAGHPGMDEDCATTMVHGNAALAPIKQPCKCISFNCATQLGCICSPALPSPFTALASPVAWELLSYWPR